MVDLNRAYQEVRTLPDEALAQELSQPSGFLPGYLIMAEMEDRKAIRSGGGGQRAPKMSMKDELLSGIQPQAPMPQPMPSFSAGGLISALNPYFAQMQGRQNPSLMAQQMQQQMNDGNNGFQPLIAPQTPGPFAPTAPAGVPGPSQAPQSLSGGGIADLLKGIM